MELTGCRPETYAPLLEILAQMGCRVETGPESAVITRLGALHGAGRVFTGVYPALATDAAPLLAAAAFWVCVSLIGLLASDAPDLNGVLGLLAASALGGLLAAGLARREKGKRAKRHKTPRSRR